MEQSQTCHERRRPLCQPPRAQFLWIDPRLAVVEGSQATKCEEEEQPFAGAHSSEEGSPPRQAQAPKRSADVVDHQDKEVSSSHLHTASPNFFQEG
jgi:hypothetical protein